MIIIIYLLLFYLLLVLWKKRRNFVFFLPVFHILVDMCFTYFSTYSILTYYRAIVLAILLGMIYKELKVTRNNLAIYVFLSFLILIVFTSEEFIYSIKVYLQIFFSLMMFVVGYKIVNSYEKLSRLNYSLYWVIIGSVLATSVGYIFNVGRSLEYTVTDTYEGDKIGLLGSGGLYIGALALSLLPSIVTFKDRRVNNFILYSCSLILYVFILLNVRRTAIVIPILGLSVYVLFTPQKLKIFIPVLIGSIALFIFSFLYGDLLEQRFSIRAEQGKFESDFYKEESRYIENLVLIEEIISFEDIGKSLFGMGNNAFAEHIKNNEVIKRMYHTDTAKLLSATGIVGFFLYLNIYVLFFRLLRKKRKRLDPNQKKLRAFALSLIIISVFASLNGSITLITFRSGLFLYLGAILKILHVSNFTYIKEIK